VNRLVTLYGAGDIRWTEAPLGPLAPGMVRVRFQAGGICGSDLHYYRHGKSGDFVLSSPLVLGHEVAGTVAELGEGVSGLMPGDQIAVDPSRRCGTCRYCLEGRANLCSDIFFMGSASRIPHMQGGFAEYFDVSRSQCHRLSSSTPLEAAALSEPLAVALHAVSRGSEAASSAGFALNSEETRVAVFGAGPIGLMILLALRQSGARRVSVVDVVDTPLSLAAKLGAHTTVNSARDADDLREVGIWDLVFEASGSPSGLADTWRTVRKGGVVVQVGNLPAGQVPAPLNLIMSKELPVAGTFRFSDEFGLAVQHITAGTIDVTPLITARMPLAEADHAFRLAQDRTRNVKVILTG